MHEEAERLRGFRLSTLTVGTAKVTDRECLIAEVISAMKFVDDLQTTGKESGPLQSWWWCFGIHLTRSTSDCNLTVIVIALLPKERTCQYGKWPISRSDRISRDCGMLDSFSHLIAHACMGDWRRMRWMKQNCINEMGARGWPIQSVCTHYTTFTTRMIIDHRFGRKRSEIEIK